VVTLAHQSARAARSGVPVDMTFGHVLTVREGLITRIEIYAEQTEALKAVGLEE
jgi:ketosteroid isomerase-like protein